MNIWKSIWHREDQLKLEYNWADILCLVLLYIKMTHDLKYKCLKWHLSDKWSDMTEDMLFYMYKCKITVSYINT